MATEEKHTPQTAAPAIAGTSDDPLLVIRTQFLMATRRLLAELLQAAGIDVLYPLQEAGVTDSQSSSSSHFASSNSVLKNVLACDNVQSTLTLTDELSSVPVVALDIHSANNAAPVRVGFFAFRRRDNSTEIPTDGMDVMQRRIVEYDPSHYRPVFRIGSEENGTEGHIIEAIYGENAPRYSQLEDLWLVKLDGGVACYSLDVALLRAYLKKVCFGS